MADHGEYVVNMLILMLIMLIDVNNWLKICVIIDVATVIDVNRSIWLKLWSLVDDRTVLIMAA